MFVINQKILKNAFFLSIAIFVLFDVTNVKAANIENYINFNIDSNFALNEKSEAPALLVKTTASLYFYVEKDWWDSQVLAKQNEILTNLDNLSYEFSNKIYPILTSVFGQEWRPGVDGDDKITVLFHLMKDNVGGYFRSSDEYIKLQAPNSNEREMVYLPIAQIDNTKLKNLLAHEFMHLITFNQKDRINDVQEEVWLNEARAEYTGNILGYDKLYESSNLQKRVKDFLEKTTDSLTEWQETKYDYALANIFSYYLIDHYGINILVDSLKSKSVGIVSINEALLKNGYKENFNQIFTDWTIAILINDCTISLKYCYLNQNLKNLRINPTINFLPLSGDSSLSVTNVIKNWAGNWQKVIGGNGDLNLKFESLQGLIFQVPYVIFNKDSSYSIKYFELNKNQEGQINIENFGNDYSSLIIIPSLQTKTSGFDGFEFTYPYTFKASITGAVLKEDQALIQKLLAQIEDLKRQIAALQNDSTSPSQGQLCLQLSSNLYLGVLNKNEVTCLQQFLKSQGLDIYPEALVTGNFGNLTKSAVIRFQEKYKNEILLPVGLNKGTGFAGTMTRIKINQLLKNEK